MKDRQHQAANHRPWLSLALGVLVSLAPFTSACAENGVTPTITITNGVDGDASGASWNSWGGLTYFASTYPYQVVYYTWAGTDSADQWFYGLSDYVNASIYHRRVIVYDPGPSQTIVWESCSPDMMDSYVLPGTGLWYQGAASTPSPTEWYGSAQTAVIYKIQSGGSPTALTATQFTLEKSTP